MSQGLFRGRVTTARCVAVALMFASSSADAAITFGQIDDFQSGTAAEWREGFSSPNPPTNIATGGPNGAGDRFLQNIASGGFGGGSKQIMFNTAQWAGNYNAAGVTRIELKLKNMGTSDLSMRLAFTGTGFTQYCTTDPVQLPVGGDWQTAVFKLDAGSLTMLGGSSTLTQALADVSELRLLSAVAPNYNGDSLVSTVGVDSIRAMRVPGDANFDGSVTFADLVLLAQNYNRIGDRTWATGDFNFDGSVTFSDLVMLAQNYNRTSVLTAGPSNADDVGDAAFRSGWARALTIVPEPSLALLPAGGLAATTRRRRRRPRGD